MTSKSDSQIEAAAVQPKFSRAPSESEDKTGQSGTDNDGDNNHNESSAPIPTQIGINEDLDQEYIPEQLANNTKQKKRNSLTHGKNNNNNNNSNSDGNGSMSNINRRHSFDGYFKVMTKDISEMENNESENVSSHGAKSMATGIDKNKRKLGNVHSLKTHNVNNSKHFGYHTGIRKTRLILNKDEENEIYETEHASIEPMYEQMRAEFIHEREESHSSYHSNLFNRKHKNKLHFTHKNKSNEKQYKSHITDDKNEQNKHGKHGRHTSHSHIIYGHGNFNIGNKTDGNILREIDINANNVISGIENEIDKNKDNYNNNNDNNNDTMADIEVMHNNKRASFSITVTNDNRTEALLFEPPKLNGGINDRRDSMSTRRRHSTHDIFEGFIGHFHNSGGCASGAIGASDSAQENKNNINIHYKDEENYEYKENENGKNASNKALLTEKESTRDTEQAKQESDHNKTDKDKDKGKEIEYEKEGISITHHENQSGDSDGGNSDSEKKKKDDNSDNNNTKQKHKSKTKLSRQQSKASQIIDGQHRESVLTRGDLTHFVPWYVINKEKITNFLYEKIYILQWLPQYDIKKWLSNDIQAGIGVATMAIPQAIAYANIAGVTPDVGLYTAMIGLLIYPLFGTSRHITVGAASISAIMTSASLAQFSELDNYHVYVNTMAFTSGIMYALMSFLGIGFIASFLALPVVIGFAAGCSWVIAASQLKYVLTIDEGGSEFLHNVELCFHLHDISWISVVITIVCIAVLQLVKRLPPYWEKLLIIDNERRTYVAHVENETDSPSVDVKTENKPANNGELHNRVNGKNKSEQSPHLETIKTGSPLESDSYEMKPYSNRKRKCLSISSKLFRQMPIALLLLVIFTLISYFVNGFSSLVNDWDENESVFLVGKVNASVDFGNLGNFIDFSLFFDHGHTELLILDSLLLCIVCFTEHVAASVNYGMKHEYDIIAGQELLGIGFVNMVGGLFGIYPAAGVITHLPMSEQSNVKTLVFNWVTGVIIIFTFVLLVLFHNLLYYLPKSVLAAIVLNACIGMFPWSEMKHVGKIDTRDTLLMIVTFLSTILLGIAEGVAVGFVFSIVLSIWRTSKPHCAILGRIPQTTIYRSIVAWPDAITTPGIIIFRFDGTLYFGNTSYFKQAIQVVCERYHRMHINNNSTHNNNSNENEHNNHNDSGFYFFILDCHCINDIDSSGINAIEKIEKMLSNTFGATLMLTGVKYPVMKHIERSGLLNIVGMHHFFHTVHEAKLYIWRRLKLLKSESFNVRDKHGYINTGKKQRQKRKREKQRQFEKEIEMTSNVNEDKGKKNDSNVNSDKLSVKFLKSAADDSGYSLHESDITNNSVSTNNRGRKEDSHDIRLDRATSIQMKAAPPLTNEEILQLRKGTRNVPMGSKLERQFDVSPQRATSIRKQFGHVLNKQDSKNKNDTTAESNEETKNSGNGIGNIDC